MCDPGQESKIVSRESLLEPYDSPITSITAVPASSGARPSIEVGFQAAAIDIVQLTVKNYRPVLSSPSAAFKAVSAELRKGSASLAGSLHDFQLCFQICMPIVVLKSISV